MAAAAMGATHDRLCPFQLSLPQPSIIDYIMTTDKDAIRPLLTPPGSSGGSTFEQVDKPRALRTSVIIAYYALCSSLMLVVNKVVIHNIPAPSTVLALQLGASAGLVYSAGILGFIQVDRLEWSKVKAFSLVVAG